MKFKKYPEYKDSGVEWLGKIPENWQKLMIKRLSKIRRGASPRPIEDPKYFDDKGKYAWVRIADVTASKMYLENTTQTLSTLGASLSVKLQPGELFLSIAGSVGKPCIANIKCCIHDGFVYFPGLKENRKYLYYLFEAGEAYKGLGKFGTQLNLNTDTVAEIYIGVPSPQEQTAIANFLDKETSKIDSLIDKKQQLIELLKEKRQAIISHAVTKGLNPDVKMKDSGIEWLGEIPEHWAVKRLKYAAIINDRSLPENTSDDFCFKYIDIGNVNILGLLEEPQEICFKNAPSRARRILKSGNTIISTVRTYLKAITYFEEINENIIASTGFAVLTPNNKLLPKYLYYTCLSSKFIDTIVANSSGVSYPAINSSSLANLPIWYPNDKEEQNSIINLIEEQNKKIDLLTSKIQTQIEKLKEYRQALISSAVTGKIDVRDYAN